MKILLLLKNPQLFGESFACIIVSLNNTIILKYKIHTTCEQYQIMLIICYLVYISNIDGLFISLLIPTQINSPLASPSRRVIFSTFDYVHMTVELTLVTCRGRIATEVFLPLSVCHGTPSWRFQHRSGILCADCRPRCRRRCRSLSRLYRGEDLHN